MQRREFLQTLAVASVPALSLQVGPTLAMEMTDQRFGDVLIRPRSSDHLELVFTPDRPRPLRFLQITDTHFHPGDDTTDATAKLLRAMRQRASPDFIIHTGDFVNNDSDEAVDWGGMEVLNSLQTPWTLCFGNHDYPVYNAPGSLPLDQIRQNMQHGFQGYVDAPTGRHYCYRYDLLTADQSRPSACLFFFQVGYEEGDRRISDPQLHWFVRQMEIDAERNVDAPISVFVHIPLREYHTLFESGRHSGVRGENVCFDSDTGESFRSFAKSKRVVGVFCGHDHVNNYHGDWEGVDLVYGRVTGWGGYGPLDWPRGGRLISFDLGSARPIPKHHEVFLDA